MESGYKILWTDHALKELAETYKLNAEQRSAIAEDREQIKNGDFLTNEQADQEIDEWLNK
jgi:hypothetical protein